MFFCTRILLTEENGTYTLKLEGKEITKSGIYLSGSMNEWKIQDAWQFYDEGDGVYALYDKDLSGTFKVTDASWTSGKVYGKNSMNATIDANTDYVMELSTGKGNDVSCGENTYNCKKIQLTITKDGEDNDVYTLKLMASVPIANKNITKVLLPATVTTIGKWAFSACHDLRVVNIPSGVTTIGQQAFASCLGLQSITLPASVRQVASRAFAECQSMLYVQTPDITAWLGITFADQYANPLAMAHRLMADGHDVKNVVIPGNIVAVSPYAFTDCSTLRSVTCEDGVRTIGASAFAGCFNLGSVTLPSTLTSIGSRALADCTTLTAIDVPEGVRELSSSLFSGCTALTGVALPSTLTSIASSAFATCTALTGIILADGVTTIGESAFKGCSSLRAVAMPASLTQLGVSAFESCGALTAVTIPDGVQEIKMQTFARCGNLVELTLGSSVNAIRLKAFADSRRLATVTCRGNIPAEVDNPDVFYRPIYNTARLFVPAGARPLYKSTGIWPWFKTIIGINIGMPYGDVNGDGEVNIADVNVVINRINLGEGDQDTLLDLNGDGEVNIADVNTVIDLILR